MREDNSVCPTKVHVLSEHGSSPPAGIPQSAPRELTIPEPVASDLDDVRWALSTAQSLMTSGAVDDALRWLRIAGESASENEHDMRAVELFKAAANLRTSMLPPPLSVRQATSSALPPPAPVPSAEPSIPISVELAHEDDEDSAPALDWDDDPTISGDFPSAASMSGDRDGALAFEETQPIKPRGPAVVPPPPPPPSPLPGPPMARTRARAAASSAWSEKTLRSVTRNPPTRARSDTDHGVGPAESATHLSPRRATSTSRPPPTSSLPPALRDTRVGLGAVRIDNRPDRSLTPSSVKIGATKFIVTVGDVPGELRVRAWTGPGDPPDKAAVAVLVPRSPRDAELIDRILEASGSGWDALGDDEPTYPGRRIR